MGHLASPLPSTAVMLLASVLRDVTLPWLYLVPCTVIPCGWTLRLFPASCWEDVAVRSVPRGGGRPPRENVKAPLTPTPWRGEGGGDRRLPRTWGYGHGVHHGIGWDEGKTEPN